MYRKKITEVIESRKNLEKRLKNEKKLNFIFFTATLRTATIKRNPQQHFNFFNFFRIAVRIVPLPRQRDHRNNTIVVRNEG